MTAAVGDSIDAAPDPNEFWRLFNAWWEHLPVWAQIVLSFGIAWVLLTLTGIGLLRRTLDRLVARVRDLEADVRRRDAAFDRLRYDLERLKGGKP